MKNFSIEHWEMDEAARLQAVWEVATASAPFAYPVEPAEFAAGIIPMESDDESCASAQSQKLLAASDTTGPVGFVHLCVGSDVEVDGENIECGIIRFLAFSPRRREVGQALLSDAEQIFQSEGLTRVDAFSLYHGYPFHNHKVGILSSRMTHVSSLLKENGYRAHDGHVTMQRSLDSAPLPDPHQGVKLIIERSDGAGALPNIRVKAAIDGQAIGSCRSQSGRTYADQDSLDWLSYTRWIGVKESYRRKGIGRHLLRRALHEMRCEGYKSAALNCREENHAAVSLYLSEGYRTRDTSLAYVKDLRT